MVVVAAPDEMVRPVAEDAGEIFSTLLAGAPGESVTDVSPTGLARNVSERMLAEPSKIEVSAPPPVLKALKSISSNAEGNVPEFVVPAGSLVQLVSAPL